MLQLLLLQLFLLHLLLLQQQRLLLLRLWSLLCCLLLQVGRSGDALCYFERLQQNLLFLAMLADQHVSLLLLLLLLPLLLLLLLLLHAVCLSQPQFGARLADACVHASSLCCMYACMHLAFCMHA